MAKPKKVVLREAELESPAEAHALLAERLSFPDYYGANLDALADCLSEVSTPTRIIMRRSEEPKPWFDGLIRVIRDQAAESCYVGCVVRQG